MPDQPNRETPARRRVKRAETAPAVELVVVNHRTVVGRHRSATTRARIVEAAAMVYAKKGPDAPVIDDFVKAAGMSRGTFYNHFTTTAELLEATIEWIDNNLAQAILHTILPYPDLAEKSALAMRLHLHWVTSDPALCAFFSRMPQVAEVGRREARAQLRMGIAAGIFKVADADAAFDMVFGTIAETIRRIALAPTKPKLCDEVVAAVLVGLGVDAVRIKQVMALPLPGILVPLRLTEAADAARATR